MAPTPIEANKEEVKAFCVSQKRVTQHVPWRAEQGTSLRSCGGGLGVGGAARNMQLLVSSGLLERPHCALTVPHPSQLSHIHHQRASANVTER